MTVRSVIYRLSEEMIMIETKDKPQHEKPEYFIVKDAHHEYLLKREDGAQTFLLRADNRTQVYDVILTDLCAPVYETTPGQMIEAAFGNPQWQYGDDFNPTPQAKRLFPEPPKPEPEKKSEKPTSRKKRKSGRQADPNGRSNPICLIHACEKRKNGKAKSGQQLWRCGLCHGGKPAGTRKGAYTRRTKRYKHIPVDERPCCVQCHRAMHSHGWYKGTIRRWFCSPCKIEVLARTPPKKVKLEDRGEELMAFVREHVTRTNGHDPQLRDDIVQELVTDIIAGKLTRKDVKSRETIRRYAHSQERLRQNRHRDVSIDQPHDGDEDGLKLKDVLEG
jgi:hypothetical protein